VPGQEMTNNWCKEDGVSLKDAYTFKVENPNTIGVEAPVWTEMVLSNEAADDRFWPRTIAMAEVGWSEEENKDYKNFIKRLSEHGLRLDLMDVHYFRTPEVEWNSDRNKGVFSEFMPKSKF
jgi:hexosaminidase